MKCRGVKFCCLFTIVLASCVTYTTIVFAQQNSSNIKYVDPKIGSVGLILEPTRPAVHLPNSMVRVFPVRADQIDDQIAYFPLTISSHRQNWLFGFMPYNDETGRETAKSAFFNRYASVRCSGLFCTE